MDSPALTASPQPRVVTLEELRDHALKNPDALYPLGSCHKCLAADFLGETVWDWEYTERGTRLPHAFAEMTQVASHTRGRFFKGSDCATAIQCLIDGERPYEVGQWLGSQG